MRIAYGNAIYHRNNIAGRNVHVGQFIKNAVELGHEVWTWPRDQHPDACQMPHSRFSRGMRLRNMDVLYTRIEWWFPHLCRWAVAPYRTLIRFPVVVWEFNTVPDVGRLQGLSEDDIKETAMSFRRYGRGCDLAVCVSDALADYVNQYLNIEHTLVIPNGSDPDLFRPDIASVRRIQKNPDQLNVVWIGSGDISWHNFDILRRAAELLWDRKRNSKVSFHIIGRLSPGIMHCMPPNVAYYGPEFYDLLPKWLTGMDVGLCLYEPGPADYGSPLKLFDYMSSGLAVVGTDHPQIRAIFGELDQLDLLVSADDPESLANILSDLAQNRHRVYERGRTGRKLVLDYYNWRRAVRDTIREIETILKSKGA